MTFHVARIGERAWTSVEGVPGLRRSELVSGRHGSVHMQVELLDLAPGAEVPAHLHPYENSWYVLAGGGRRDVGGLSYEVAEADYGLSPIGVAHRAAAGSQGMRWLSVSAPRPPVRNGALHAIPAQLPDGVPLGRPSETDPRHQWTGHFSESDIAPYAQLSMPGYHGGNIKNIAVHMLVDELLGAVHHTMFMVEFAAGLGPGQAAGEHYHPFEEAYFLLSGSALGTLDGEEVTVSAGDLVWTGTDATHGFINRGDAPVRWIEVQSPVPPRSNAFFFPADWAKLASAEARERGLRGSGRRCRRRRRQPVHPREPGRRSRGRHAPAPRGLRGRPAPPRPRAPATARAGSYSAPVRRASSPA